MNLTHHFKCTVLFYVNQIKIFIFLDNFTNKQTIRYYVLFVKFGIKSDQGSGRNKLLGFIINTGGAHQNSAPLDLRDAVTGNGVLSVTSFISRASLYCVLYDFKTSYMSTKWNN